MDSADSQLGADLRTNVHNVWEQPALLIYKKKTAARKETVFSVLLLIKNQQYFIFKKINSNCQLLAGYPHIKTFYRNLLILQKNFTVSQTLIFLPPYSPEYNPIEHTWSALKRKVASCVHLYSSVSQALDAVLKGN